MTLVALQITQHYKEHAIHHFVYTSVSIYY